MIKEKSKLQKKEGNKQNIKERQNINSACAYRKHEMSGNFHGAHLPKKGRGRKTASPFSHNFARANMKNCWVPEQWCRHGEAEEGKMRKGRGTIHSLTLIKVRNAQRRRIRTARISPQHEKHLPRTHSVANATTTTEAMVPNPSVSAPYRRRE